MNNVKALNGIGPGAGKGARERATERAFAQPIVPRIVATLNPRFFGINPRAGRRRK